MAVLVGKDTKVICQGFTGAQGRRDDPLRDHVAAHDATEDIDENAFDV